MAVTRQTVATPEVNQYFRRIPQPPNPFAAVLEALMVAPWYQIVRAFSGTEPVASAQVTFEGEDGAAGGTDYNEGYYAADPRYFTLPGLRQGATVDTAWSSIWATIGSGLSRTTYALNSPAAEQVLITRATGVTVAENASYFGSPGTGERQVTFPGVDFTVILADYDLPGVGGTGGKADFLNDTVLYVEPELYPGRKLRVLGIDPAANDTLIVEDDIFVDEISALDAPADGATLSVLPAAYTWFASGNRASRPLAGHTLSLSSTAGDETCSLDGGGTTRCYNFDTVAEWEVIFQLAAGADDPASVAISYTNNAAPALNRGTVTITLGTTGAAFDPADNGVGTINALIRRAFRSFSRTGEAPVQFYPEVGSFANATPDDDGGAPDGTIDFIPPAVRNWDGSIRAKDVGVAGNGYRVTIQTHGTPGVPTMERIGNHWLISLSTTPALNTVDFINGLLSAAGDLIEITADTPATDEVDIFSLGELRNHGGYEVEAWFPNSQSYYLEGGLAKGGVKVAGGLVPQYSVVSPNLVAMQLYTEYRALRVDKSANASTAVTGNRPDLTFVTPDDYEDVVGEVNTDNPIGLACSEYFANANGRRLAIMSIGATSTSEPWGTSAATQTLLEFAQRRDVYHIYLLNDAGFIYADIVEWATSLGGTETVPLKRPQRFYVPTKNFEARPDIAVASGSSASEDPGTPTNVTLDIDVSTLLDAAGLKTPHDPSFDYFYVIQFSADATNANGDVTLQDGTKAYTILAKNVGGSPFAIEVNADITGAGPHGAYQILRVGASLYESDVYQSQEAAEALYDYHDLTRHRRVLKHHCDSYEGVVDGSFVTLDGVYLLAQFAGIVANQSDHLPVTNLQYARARNVRGTTDTYSDTASQNQLELLMGAGLVLPAQKGATGSGPVYVMRDLSTDSLTSRVSRRRTAGVTEDKLSIELDRLIRPRLGPNLVTEQYLDRIAMDIDKMLQDKKNPGASREFKSIQLETLLPITDEVRAEFGIDDSGVMVEFTYTHLDEAAQAIVRHIVRPS